MARRSRRTRRSTVTGSRPTAAQITKIGSVNDLSGSDDAASLTKMLRASRRTVVFTGAGISTESGIPDFRSPGGIWTQMAPIYFQDFVSSEEARAETWRRRFAMEDIFRAAQPNRGHRAVDA